jgi:hypothetical protein
VHFYQRNRPYGFSSFFGLVRFTSVQLTSSPPFPLPGVTSPTFDVVTPSRRVTLPFYWVKMSSLPPPHLLVMLLSRCHPTQVKIEALNLHYRRRAPSLDRLTLILYHYKKGYLNLDHYSHHSTTSLFYLLPSKSTTSSELHSSPSFTFTVVSRSLSLHTMTLTVMNWSTVFCFPNNLLTF